MHLDMLGYFLFLHFYYSPVNETSLTSTFTFVQFILSIVLHVYSNICYSELNHIVLVVDFSSILSKHNDLLYGFAQLDLLTSQLLCLKKINSYTDACIFVTCL